MSYLERLRTVEHEKTGTLATDKTDRRAFVSFVSSLGAPFPRGDDCDADLSEARSNQHSSQRLCSVCGQPARGAPVARRGRAMVLRRPSARQSWERLNMIAYDKNPVRPNWWHGERSWALARIMLAEQAREALGLVED
jgi:hypothetical protein